MLLFAMICLLARPACATYRADFFDTSKRPVITFDKGRLTWTLRNQGVERVVHFDGETGGLQTLALRDLHTHHVLLPAPNSEGEISFAAPLLQTPTPLTGWKYTEIEPAGAWTQRNYDDKSWKPVDMSPPVGSADGDGSLLIDERTGVAPPPVQHNYWYRVLIPAGRMKAGHAYALYVPHGIAEKAEAYADGYLIHKSMSPPFSGAASKQIDLPAGCHALAIHAVNGAPLPAYIVEVGTAPPNLHLASGWQYMMHTTNAGEDNSRILTIHLSGVKQYEGFELDVNYQIYAGEEPTLAKWFGFVSHRKSHFLMDMVIYDRWPLSQKTNYPAFRGIMRPFVQADTQTGDVLLTGGANQDAMFEHEPDQNHIAPTAALNVAVQPELPLQTPRSITAFWHGTQAAGEFLYQLYLGQYVVGGSPTVVPIVYNTRYAYADKFDAATCERIIPFAARLGAQAFILGDGWQSNVTPDTGRYGDWFTDKDKFPNGLQPISTLVRENKMRFGLWTDAAAVNDRSQAATAHPDWLYKSLPRTEGEDAANHRMCFTGAWERQYTQSLLSLCREQSVTYLQTSFMPLDGCMATAHEHPTGYSRAAEQEGWAAFCNTLRQADKNFVVVGDDTNYNAPLTPEEAARDLTWLEPFDNSFHHKPQRIGVLLDFQARIHTLEDEQNGERRMTPQFTRVGQALCHLPTGDTVSRDQLEYFWTSAAARYCNFEIQGDLECMTSDEREIGHKWIEWNLQNRDWLAFAQPMTLTSPDAPHKDAAGVARPEVAGMLHLRNALHGRYGYVCLWNQAGTASNVTPSFNPADYFVRMRTGDVKITNISGGVDMPFTVRGGVVTLGKIMLPAHGWAIYEISVK